jgi:uncharacterized protein (TIGR03118 family)
MHVHLFARPRLLALVLATAVLLLVLLPVTAAGAQGGGFYQQRNLVSDLPNLAQVRDKSLVNPWGISHSPNGPWQVSDNGTSVDSTHAILEVDRSAVSQGGFTGAVYKGLALASSNSKNFLYATNFRFGQVEQFDANFKLVNTFTDPALASDCPIPGPPAQCFAPFGIQSINDQLYVAFALQDAAHHDDVAGIGNGFVDVFNPNGTLIRRFASEGTLNSPWGLALAPANFGQFSNDVLVGNFGDGRINAFNPVTGAFLDQLRDGNGNVIAINGLWGLAFGNGALAGPTNTLFFAAGFNDEADGLFGTITPA